MTVDIVVYPWEWPLGWLRLAKSAPGGWRW